MLPKRHWTMHSIQMLRAQQSSRDTRRRHRRRIELRRSVDWLLKACDQVHAPWQQQEDLVREHRPDDLLGHIGRLQDGQQPGPSETERRLINNTSITEGIGNKCQGTDILLILYYHLNDRGGAKKMNDWRVTVIIIVKNEYVTMVTDNQVRCLYTAILRFGQFWRIIYNAPRSLRGNISKKAINA